MTQPDTIARYSTVESLAKLFEIAGVRSYCAQSNGCSQGDSAEVLVVATPEAIKARGVTDPITDEMLAEQVKLYGAWAWGDVYGYVIERRAALDCFDGDDDGTREDWEELDSCWGFYGSDFDWSGLEEAAMEACPDPETDEVLLDRAEQRAMTQ